MPQNRKKIKSQSQGDRDIKEQKPMGHNKRNDEINAITKESIAYAYYELLQKEQRISVTSIFEKA